VLLDRILGRLAEHISPLFGRNHFQRLRANRREIGEDAIEHSAQAGGYPARAGVEPCAVSLREWTVLSLMLDLGMHGRSQLLRSEIVCYFLASIAEGGRHPLSRDFPLGEAWKNSELS
jgi:hypothetical protein